MLTTIPNHRSKSILPMTKLSFYLMYNLAINLHKLMQSYCFMKMKVIYYEDSFGLQNVVCRRRKAVV